MTISSSGAGYQLGDGNSSEVRFVPQGAPIALTTSATLTAAQLAVGLLTANQGGGATATYTLPTGTLMDAAFGNFRNDTAFEFSLINVSTVAAEDVTIAAGTGWTLVGNPTVNSNDAITSVSSGRFRARKTGTATWTLYRIA